MRSVNGRAVRRQALPDGAAARLSPGQLALPIDVPVVAKTKRVRRPTTTVETVELDLGPLLRRPKPKPGPKWPPMTFTYEDLSATPESGR